MITTDKTQLNINVLTQEQYEQAKTDETLDQDGLYMVDDDIHQMGVELDFNGLYKRGLLWENPNPSASFPAQVVTPSSSGWIGGNLSKGDIVEVEVKSHTSNTGGALFRGSIYGGYSTNNSFTCFIQDWTHPRLRRVYAGTNGVSFDGGYEGATSNDACCVPTKIYGIKKLQPSYNVIPQQVDYVVDNSNGRRVWKSGKVDDYNEYSTEEKRIGTWIDGKPLYEKAFTFTTGTSLSYWYDVSHNIQNVDKIFVKNGYLVNADNTATAILSIPDYHTQIGANTSHIRYVLIGDTNYENKQAVIILNYTKTTD